MRLLHNNFVLACSLGLFVLSAPLTTSAQTPDETEALSLTEAALRSPAVASILEMPRKTPAEQMQAIFLLLDLGEGDAARTLWGKFSTEAKSDEVLAKLVREFGAARFLKLARLGTDSGLEGARTFAESCLRAAAELNRDPEQLAKLVNDLSDDSAKTRAAARSDLAVTGTVGAVGCLEALAEADDEQLRTELMLTLTKMRPGVEPLLIAALADGRGQFRRDVVELVGHMHLQDSVAWLAAIATGADSEPTVVGGAHAALAKMGYSSPNLVDARAVVLSALHQLETHDQPPVDEPFWWTFDPETKKLSSREVSAAENQLLKIARLARTLSRLPNATSEDHRLALVYAFQVSDAMQQPLPKHLQQLAETLTVGDISETLHSALQGNQISAATACVNLLATRADASALASASGVRGPLAQALVHPDRRLKYAALEAVMKISPQQSFAGASGVAPALWQFAASAGTPQAIAASSNVSRASNWAGQLRSFGYDATPVTTGRDALLTALSSPRLKLILVDSDIGRPLVREVIYSLRSNPQLSRIPVAVLSSLHNLSRSAQIAEQDPWLLSTPRPHGNDAMETVLAELNGLNDSLPSNERRTDQAKAALGWIAELLENGHPYDELLRESHLVSQTLYNPDLSPSSLRVLAALGTAESQRLLLDYLSTPTLPIESRRSAAEAFTTSVRRFGKLLTSAEILKQYDRYNASETADAETQKVLGSVLDVLEKQK